MLLFDARNNQGFTLLETLVIVVIIGILSAIAAPSFLSLLNRNKVNNALDQLRGALQEAQREAIRKSQSCTVSIDTTNKKVTAPCLVTGGRTLSNGVAIATNISGTPPAIVFSYRGTITLPNAGTIVVLSPDNANEKKCLVISSPLGIIRTGKYTAAPSSPTAANCSTTP